MQHTAYNAYKDDVLHHLFCGSARIYPRTFVCYAATFRYIAHFLLLDHMITQSYDLVAWFTIYGTDGNPLHRSHGAPPCTTPESSPELVASRVATNPSGSSRQHGTTHAAESPPEKGSMFCWFLYSGHDCTVPRHFIVLSARFFLPMTL